MIVPFPGRTTCPLHKGGCWGSEKDLEGNEGSEGAGPQLLFDPEVVEVEDEDDDPPDDEDDDPPAVVEVGVLGERSAELKAEPKEHTEAERGARLLGVCFEYE